MFRSYPPIYVRGCLQLSLCLFWETTCHPSPPLPISLLFSFSNGECLRLPSQIHVQPCTVSHGYPCGGSFWKAPSLSWCVCESCPTFNVLSQWCNCKCCMLTCALMVAPARPPGVLMGRVSVRWRRLVVRDKWGKGRCNLFAAGWGSVVVLCRSGYHILKGNNLLGTASVRSCT